MQIGVQVADSGNCNNMTMSGSICLPNNTPLVLKGAICTIISSTRERSTTWTIYDADMERQWLGISVDEPADICHDNIPTVQL